MQIIYHPLNNDGTIYTGGDRPVVAIYQLGATTDYWNGTVWTSTLGAGVQMTSLGNGDWEYTIDDANFSTGQYQVNASAAFTGLTQSNIGTIAELNAIYAAMAASEPTASVRVTYQPIDDASGEVVIAGTSPIQAIMILTRIDPSGPVCWNGVNWTGRPETNLNMASDGAFGWHYDTPSLGGSLGYRVQCSIDSGNATKLDVTGTGAEIAAMFAGDTTAAAEDAAEAVATPAGPTETAYASILDYANFEAVDVSTLSADLSRLLLRASESIDDYTMGRINRNNPNHAHAARMATCAQVEFWYEVGEDRDIAGPVEEYESSKVRMGYGRGRERIAPSYICPRAARYLRRAGLLYRGAGSSLAGANLNSGGSFGGVW